MIRPGIETDVVLIREFDEFSNFRLKEVVEERIHVFESCGEVLGYVTLASYRFHGFPLIEFLCVKPSRRREGIASALMLHVESIFAGKRVFTSTEGWNTNMKSLLDRRGYSVSGSLLGLNKDGTAEVYFYRDIPSSNREG